MEEKKGLLRDATLADTSLHRCYTWHEILLMDKILHGPKDPKLWELWYIPYNG